MNRIVIVAIIVLIIIGALVYVELNSGKHSVTTSPPRLSPCTYGCRTPYTVEAQLLGSSFQNSTGIQVPAPKGGGSFGLAREIASEGSNAQVSVFMPVALSAASPSYWGTIVPVGP
jgi:hypothetical protein